MTESDHQRGEAAQSAEQPITEVARAGLLLQQARQASHQSVADLAAVLRIVPTHIEALESGRIDLLPNLAYARALASSICRQLKVPTQPVLEHLPSSIAKPSDSIFELPEDTSVGRSSFHSHTGRVQVKSKMYVALGVLLFVGAALVYWWPELTATTQVVAGESVESLQSVAGDSSASTLLPSVETGAINAESVANTGNGSAAVNAANPSALTAGSQSLELTVSKDVFIHVREKGNQSILNRIVKAGEKVSLNAMAPVRLTVGRSDAIVLMVNGQPYDLAPHTKANVARFELK